MLPSFEETFGLAPEVQSGLNYLRCGIRRSVRSKASAMLDGWSSLWPEERRGIKAEWPAANLGSDFGRTRGSASFKLRADGLEGSLLLLIFTDGSALLGRDTPGAPRIPPRRKTWGTRREQVDMTFLPWIFVLKERPARGLPKIKAWNPHSAPRNAYMRYEKQEGGGWDSFPMERIHTKPDSVKMILDPLQADMMSLEQAFSSAPLVASSKGGPASSEAIRLPFLSHKGWAPEAAKAVRSYYQTLVDWLGVATSETWEICVDAGLPAPGRREGEVTRVFCWHKDRPRSEHGDLRKEASALLTKPAIEARPDEADALTGLVRSLSSKAPVEGPHLFTVRTDPDLSAHRSLELLRRFGQPSIDTI